MILQPGIGAVALSVPIESFGETITSVIVRVPTPLQLKRARRRGVPIEFTNLALCAGISAEAAAALPAEDFIAIAKTFATLVEETTAAANAIVAAGRPARGHF